MADEKPKLPPNAIEFRQTRAAAEHLEESVTAAITQINAITAPPASKESPKVMRGMKRLANLAPSIVASIDAEADAVADQLVAQQERAKQAIGQFRGFAATIGKTADDIEAALGQLTNDPTQASDGSA